MAVILRCIVGVNTSTKRGAKRVGENTKMNSWCTINFIVCKNGQVIKVVKNFLFWQSRLYSNDPCIFQWILPQEIFSKKKKKMHVYRNHKIASFTPPGKKKINSYFCPQISSWVSVKCAVQFSVGGSFHWVRVYIQFNINFQSTINQNTPVWQSPLCIQLDIIF